MAAEVMSEGGTGPRLGSIVPGLHPFCTRYIRPRHMAVFVIADGDDAAPVDTGVAANVEPLHAALESLGVGREATKAVIATHARLDHAGAAGRLFRALPRAWSDRRPPARVAPTHSRIIDDRPPVAGGPVRDARAPGGPGPVALARAARGIEMTGARDVARTHADVARPGEAGATARGDLPR